jgi:hypothetical protein
MLLASAALAQSPQPNAPQLLPTLPLNSEPTPPSDNKLISFDPNQVAIRRVGGTHQLYAGKQFLKDFGPLVKEAEEAVRIIRDLNVSRYGYIPGSLPPFEYWLVEGYQNEPSGPPTRGITRQIIPFDARSLRADQVSGVWVVRDAKRILYNFGREADAARAAEQVCKKYGFNQIGVIGAPNPVMTYLVIDPYQGVQAQQTAHPLELADSVSRLGLILPQIGYVGSRTKIDQRKLEIVREGSDWSLMHSSDVVGRFGANESNARAALRALQDYRVTELCRIGTLGYPLFLVNGQPLKGAPLGLTPRGFQPQALRLQKIDGNWWLCEGSRQVIDCGPNEDEAKLLQKVISHFGLDQLVCIGHPLREVGMNLLIKGR